MSDLVKPRLVMNDFVKPWLVMNDFAKPRLFMNDFAKPELVMNDFAKPKSGRFCFMLRVIALCPPSGVCWCTSERAEYWSDAYTIDTPALRFRRTSRLKSCRASRLRFRRTSLGSLCCDHSFARILSAKPEVSSGRFLHAKPESGRFCLMLRVIALCPPSGVCWCTSERAECWCGAYTIDTPALRLLFF